MTTALKYLLTVAISLVALASLAAPATMNWSAFPAATTADATDDFLVGTGPAGNKALKRISRKDLSREMGNAVSVRDFGAVADGTTDNHTAITNAISYALANGLGTVYFPDDPTVAGAASIYSDSGQYNFWGNAASGTLLLKGSGKSEWRSTRTNGIFLKGCMLLEDITIRGSGKSNGIAPFYTNHVGVFMAGATTAWSYKNVRIHDFGRGLLTLYSGMNLWSPFISNCKIGIGVGNQSDCWVVSGAYVTTCDVAGVEMGAPTPAYEPAGWAAITQPKGSQNFHFSGLTSGNGVDLIWGGSAPQGVFQTYSERATNAIVDIGHNTNVWYDLGLWEQGAGKQGDLVLANTTGTILPNGTTTVANATNAVRLWAPGRIVVSGCNFSVGSAKPVIRSMNAAGDSSQVVWESVGEDGKTNLVLSSGIAVKSQRFTFNMGNLAGNSFEAYDWAANPSGYLFAGLRHTSAPKGPLSVGWAQNTGDRFSLPRNWVHMRYDSALGYRLVLDGVSIQQSNTVDSVSATNTMRNLTAVDYLSSMRALNVATNGAANPLSAWPTTPAGAGGGGYTASFVQSNGWVYALHANQAGSAWVKTNLISQGP